MLIFLFSILTILGPSHPGMQMQPQGPPMPPMGYQGHQMPPNVSTHQFIFILIYT